MLVLSTETFCPPRFRQSCFTRSRTLYICDDRLDDRAVTSASDDALAVAPDAECCETCQPCHAELSHLLYLDASGTLRQGQPMDGCWRAWTVGEPFASHNGQDIYSQLQESCIDFIVADSSYTTSIAQIEPERLAQGLALAQELGRATARGGVAGLHTLCTIKHLSCTANLSPLV